MSLENEDQSSPDKTSETLHVSQKVSKISYTREFLLSLSDLDVCKDLPRGFDRSVFSEFEEHPHGLQDRERAPGSLPLQSFRRSDYSSSPPTGGDSSSYPRGTYVRWENRSSGRSDKDSDSKSDWDSDSAKRYGNQSQGSWQRPEHDGLLGSGSFPRPSGYAAGMSAPKVQADDHYQLKRSNEPYHPPRPYKAAPHLRRETNDSLNDETFGSTELNTEDRAEEERRRRASFESMRKEQHKMHQEKQKSNLVKHKDDFASLLEETKDERGPLEQKDGSATVPTPNDDTGSSIPAQTSAFRPLVPPGFTGTVSEKIYGPKSLLHTHEKEVGKAETEENFLYAKAELMQNGSLNNIEEGQLLHEIGFSKQQAKDTSIPVTVYNRGEKKGNPSSTMEVSKKLTGLENRLYMNSSLPKGREVSSDGEISELTAKKVTGDKIARDSNEDNSTTILEKLFGSAPTVNIGGSLGSIEHHDGKPDDLWSPKTAHSSKFAQWFLEDEKKPANDLSSGGPTDLLSLIVGGEKGGSQVSSVKINQQIPPQFSFQGSELTKMFTSSIPSASTGISEPLNISNKQAAVTAVLTCEDLEQTMLSEYSENTPTLPPSVEDRTVGGAKMVQTKAKIDNDASQHLLSLLQKGAGLKDTTPPSNVDIGLSDKLHDSDIGNTDTTLDKPNEADAGNITDSGKTITLETLFGTAFMKELQSIEAPVSVHRASVGSAGTDFFESHGLSFQPVDDGSFPSKIDEVGFNRRNHEANALAPKHKQNNKVDKFENWLGFDDPQREVDSSKFQAEVMLKEGTFDRAVEIQLPEEESLITVGDPVMPRNSMLMPVRNSTKGEFFSSNTPIDIAEKLAALNAGFKGERPMVAQEGPPSVRGPYDLMESERQYHNLHAQSSSSNFHHPLMSHGRPLFHALDSHSAHGNSQMKFMAPDSIIQHDSPPNNLFPANTFRPPFQHRNTGLAGFDHPAHNQMVQQMQMPNNFPPPHLLHEFPRGAPMPPQSGNQATGFLQEPNRVQGFNLGHRQHNLGGLGMPLPGPDVSSGSNHPEALQRLLGMEISRPNPKQIQSFGAGHSQGMYGHELDMGFQYR